MNTMHTWKTLACLIAFGGMAWESPVVLGAGNRPAQKGLDLLITPSRYTTLQVAFDILQREGGVLVAYQGEADTARPDLHVWDGAQWIPIAPEDFSDSTYLSRSPTRIVLVGDDATLPGSLVDAAMRISAAKVLQIPTQDTAELLNSLGRVYAFSIRDWDWFAARYRLDLIDSNADLRGISYYDQPVVGQRPPLPWSRRGDAAPQPAGDELDSVTVDVSPPDEPFEVSPAPVLRDPLPAEIENPPEEWEERAVATEAPIK